jgi:hypothetical protein
MLCFEFDDGSGGSQWPVDEAWLPPSALSAADEGTSMGMLFVIALGAIAVVGISILGFRRR